MRFAIAGLGSMGKRRIRCLKALGHTDIIGFDKRSDRRKEVEELYNIKTVDAFNKIDTAEIDALIVSVPPDRHIDYMRVAVENKIPAFVEASVTIEGMENLDNEARKKKVLIAPSCTLRFHPAIKDIKRIVKSGVYGSFTNFSYHCGQYLPDWHPWEKITDYYVSKKKTGGAREIVPFELTWIVDVVGYPQDVKGFVGRTMDLGADIDDTYSIALKFQQGYGCLMVDVVSRNAVRNLLLNMEYGQILWNWDQKTVHLYDALNERWIDFTQKSSSSQTGYNRNIIEDMYIEELDTFIKASQGKAVFPNTLSEDIDVLKILYRSERRK